MGGGETDKGGSRADVAFIQPDRNHLEYIYFYIYTHTNSWGGQFSSNTGGGGGHAKATKA